MMIMLRLLFLGATPSAGGVYTGLVGGAKTGAGSAGGATGSGVVENSLSGAGAAGVAGASILAPQLPQKAAPSATGLLQYGQFICFLLADMSIFLRPAAGLRWAGVATC
jgi:hypothetical protein